MSSNIVGNAREVGELFCDLDLLGREFAPDKLEAFRNAVAAAFAGLLEEAPGKDRPHISAVFCGRRVRGPIGASPLSRSFIWVLRVFARDDENYKIRDLADVLSELQVDPRGVGKGKYIPR